MANELPYQTYERITGQKWTGGSSAQVQDAYKQYGVTGTPGSATANLALQKAMLASATPKVIKNQSGIFQSTESTTQDNNKNANKLGEYSNNYFGNNGKATTDTSGTNTGANIGTNTGNIPGTDTTSTGKDTFNGKELTMFSPTGFNYSLPPLTGNKTTYLFDNEGHVYTKDKSGNIELDIKGEEQYQKNKEFNDQVVERNKLYDNYKIGLDAAHQALIDRIKQQATEQRERMTDLNKRYLGLKETQAYRTGGMEYTPEIATGVLEDEEAKGLKRLKEIDDNMLIALAEAKSAKTQQDFLLLKQRLEDIEKLQNNKEKTVLQIYKTYMDNAKYIDDKIKEADTIQRSNRDQALQELEVKVPKLVDDYNKIKSNTEKQAYIDSIVKKTGLDSDIIMGAIKKGALDIADKRSLIANRNNNTPGSDATTNSVSSWFDLVKGDNNKISSVPKEYKNQVIKMLSNSNKMLDTNLLKMDLADPKIVLMINEGFANGFGIDEMLSKLKLPNDIKSAIKSAIITKSPEA